MSQPRAPGRKNSLSLVLVTTRALCSPASAVLRVELMFFKGNGNPVKPWVRQPSQVNCSPWKAMLDLRSAGASTIHGAVSGHQGQLWA